MDTDYIIFMGRETMETALLVSAPILAVCMVSGIIISLFQTVTQIRDMTLTIVPKLVGVGVVALLFGNWMLQVMMRFTTDVFAQIQTYGQ